MARSGMNGRIQATKKKENHGFGHAKKLVDLLSYVNAHICFEIRKKSFSAILGIKGALHIIYRFEQTYFKGWFNQILAL